MYLRSILTQQLPTYNTSPQMAHQIPTNNRVDFLVSRDHIPHAIDTNTVTIHYGPTDTFFTLCHRPQKLVGVTNELKRLNYMVKMAEESWINFCVIEMCGHNVFSTNLNKFGFNLPYQIDNEAKRAVNAVLDATEKFNRAEMYLAFWNEFYSIGNQVVKKAAKGSLPKLEPSPMEKGHSYSIADSYVKLH